MKLTINLHKQFNNMDKIISQNEGFYHSFNEILLATTMGVLSFPLSLGSLQKLLFKPLRITSKLPNSFVSICGVVSVFISGVTASGAFVVTFKASNSYFCRDEMSPQESHFEFNTHQKDIFLWGFSSLAIFKVFGGKGRYVIPSHLFWPGAFAKRSIPAAGRNYARPSVKKKLYLLG